MSDEYWIQEAIQRPGRVREYMKRKYGDEAFNKDGTLKISYLKKAKKEVKDPSLKQAINLAIRLKRMNKKTKKKKKHVKVVKPKKPKGSVKRKRKRKR